MRILGVLLVAIISVSGAAPGSRAADCTDTVSVPLGGELRNVVPSGVLSHGGGEGLVACMRWQPVVATIREDQQHRDAITALKADIQTRGGASTASDGAASSNPDAQARIAQNQAELTAHVSSRKL